MSGDESTADERINAADETLLEIPYPSIVKRGIAKHGVTPNEIHAMIIGLSGYLFATMWQAGDQIYTTPMVLILPAYAIIGHPVLAALPHDHETYSETIGLKTIRSEPWWFLFTYTLTFVLVVGYGL